MAVVRASASKDEERGELLLDDLINEVCGKHFSPNSILSDAKFGMSVFINPSGHTLQKNRANI